MSKPGRVENPVLEQSGKRKEIDKRRKHNQLNKTSIILHRISIVIAILALLFGIYYHLNTKNSDQADKQQISTKSTISYQILTVSNGKESL